MLTAQQLEERRKGIGGSDAYKIVTGDWHSLWLDKTGQARPEDLSGVFAVQLGIVTETLNLDWYERKLGIPVVGRGKVMVHNVHEFLRCTLDGIVAEPEPTVIQAKHCNSYSKIEDLRVRYMPQVMHEMIVCGAKKGILSVIIGTNEPVLEPFEYDEFWATEYIERCRDFWGHVERNEAPAQGAPLAITPVQPSAMRKVDMTGQNAWASGAEDWLNHRKAAQLFKAAEKDLKSMVSPDVCEASGHGIIITRSKVGLSIKEKKQ